MFRILYRNQPKRLFSKYPTKIQEIQNILQASSHEKVRGRVTPVIIKPDLTVSEDGSESEQAPAEALTDTKSDLTQTLTSMRVNLFDK